jgi:hypothetical protein
MSRLDDLPPDQRATLSLLLRRGKSYAEVATMLDIDERAVHDRAHAALAVLAAPQARALSAAQREEVGDYLLSQRTGVAERLATRTYLDGSAEARDWARAIAAELAPLAGSALPEIPAGAASAPAAAPAQPVGTPAQSEPAPTPPSRQRPASSRSRIGGAVLLGLILAGVIVAVVLLASGGSSHNSATNADSEGSAGETGSTGKGSTGTQTAQAKEDKRITLTPPNGAGNAAGVAEVLSEGNQYAVYLAAQRLPQSKGKGFFYAVWLYNSPTSFEAVSRAPDVTASGNVQGGALLPKDAGKYHTLLLTRETASRPTKPGPVVLRGAFALH